VGAGHLARLRILCVGGTVTVTCRTRTRQKTFSASFSLITARRLFVFIVLMIRYVRFGTSAPGHSLSMRVCVRALVQCRHMGVCSRRGIATLGQTTAIFLLLLCRGCVVRCCSGISFCSLVPTPPQRKAYKHAQGRVTVRTSR
jgi:hypothetical protein